MVSCIFVVMMLTPGSCPLRVKLICIIDKILNGLRVAEGILADGFFDGNAQEELFNRYLQLLAAQCAWYIRNLQYVIWYVMRRDAFTQIVLNTCFQRII